MVMRKEILAVLGLIAAGAGSADAGSYSCSGCELSPFEMRYEVSRDGKALGEAKLSLRSDDGELWTLQMEVQATKGLAGFAGYSEVERSSLQADAQGWRVVRYERKRKVAFRNRDERMDFDWGAQRLSSQREGKANQVQLPAGTVDSNSLTLLLGHLLRHNQPLQQFTVARRGSVDQWQFALNGTENVNGHQTQRVERVREDSKRTTSSWFSPAHDYLPIRLQQVEEDGETITMTLRDYRRG